LKKGQNQAGKAVGFRKIKDFALLGALYPEFKGEVYSNLLRKLVTCMGLAHPSLVRSLRSLLGVRPWN